MEPESVLQFKILGALIFFSKNVFNTQNIRPWAILENLVVDHRYRGSGLGHLLIEHALELCREAGCYKVQLLSSNKRKGAHQFYRSQGFQESAVGFRMYY